MKEPTTNLNISLFFADHLTRMEERDNRAVINKYWDKTKKMTTHTLHVYGRYIGDSPTPIKNQKYQSLEVINVWEAASAMLFKGG